MKIEALTLTWNGLDKLEKLRPTLLNNIKNFDFTWKIRDNGSKDETCNVISKWDEVNLLSIDHNRDNFAKGVNSLVNFNDKDNSILLLLNNDVQFIDSDSIKRMIDLLDNAKIVGCKLLFNNTDQLQHAGVIFGKKYGNMPYHFRHFEKDDDNSSKNRYFQAVTAACMLIRKQDFIKVGGMDENFNWAFDDIDLCLKLLGNKIAYCGKTKIFHEESSSLKKNPVNKLWLDKNVTYFKQKWFGKYKLDHENYLNNKNYNLV